MAEKTVKEPEIGDLITVKMPEWLAEKKEVDTTFKGVIQEESKRAWQVEDIWIPKSQVRVVNIERRERESEDHSRMVDIRRQVALKAAVKALKIVYRGLPEKVPEEEVVDSTREIANGFLEWLEED